MNLYVQTYRQPLSSWMSWKLFFSILQPFFINGPSILLHSRQLRRAPVLLQANAIPMPDAEKPAGEAATYTTLKIKLNDEIEILRFQEVIWLQSDNKGVTIQTIHKKYLLYRSLRSIEQELDMQQFVRIHRSAIVNRSFIQSITQLPNGDGYVLLTTGEELRFSRNYKKNLIA